MTVVERGTEARVLVITASASGHGSPAADSHSTTLGRLPAGSVRGLPGMQTGIAIAQRASGQARNQIIFLCLNPHSVALGFEMSNPRAVRYRRLALAEEDKAKADLLLKLADECDRGLLCTAE